MPRLANSETLFRHLPAFCGAAVALPSIIILSGWYFRLPALRAPFPVGHPITPWGALLFLLLGITVFIHSRWESQQGPRVLSTIAAGFVLLHSGAVIFEYVSGLNLGIDALFMRSRVLEWWASPAPPGRYALNAGFAFAGLAVALLLRNRRFRSVWPSELLALMVVVLALLGLVGYAYHVHALSGLGQKVWMARNGSLMFGTLAIGTFFLGRDRGIARLVTSPGSGGIVARRLLTASMASSFALGWIAIHAIRTTLVSVEVATASLIAGTMVATAILILVTSAVVNRVEAARQRDSLALQETAQRLQLATDAAELGVWTWDSAADEISCFERAKQLFGIQEERQTFPYSFFVSCVHPDDRERLRANSLKTATGDYANEYRVIRHDGAVRWVAVRGRRFSVPSSEARVIGVAWDITERKLSEEALIRSEKLASVGRMAASIAHEVNNPLAAVTNLIYLCRSLPSLPPEARQYLLNAEAELGRVAHITRQTLGFYREQQSPSRVSIEELLQELCRLYAPRAAQNRIRLVTRVSTPLGMVWGNAGEIRQVISNLMVNAFDAMANGGTLQIRLAQAGSILRITVADTGSGMHGHSRHRIFEPFFTTKQTTGTGLGLWICRQIVERYRGDIRVRSRLGYGTVFVVDLPASAAPRALAVASSAGR